MAQIFISYRRDDVPGYVRALMLEMKNMVGSQQVFLDMEDIEAGSDFVSIIEDALSHCEVLLAIVGPQWLTSTNHLEQRRLDDPNDFVRLEIATALRRNIPAIPVLIENAKMPSEDDLPSDLKPLARLQGVPLAHSHWDDDINRLFRAIECVTDEPKLSRLYSQAMTELNEGRWQDALRSFQAIESIRPGYRDVAERIYPLSELAHGIMRLGPAPRGWRNAVARCPVLSMIVVSIFPNCLAAVFNFKYNWEAIVVPMQHRVQQAESLFQISAAIVNGVGFTLGLALFAYLARPVSLVLREVAHGGPGGLENLKPARDRCLKLGHFAALIGVVLWAMAGPVYPLMIGTLELPDYVYFVAS
ncbi:MAG TPA: TIR domain-containing protein, partial [Methylococcaceae bacterium]|nr:TIR domain-containing protein [Methylococcaceae bacterium]